MKLRLIFFTSLVCLGYTSFLGAEGRSTAQSFLPTWKLLSSQEKQVFVAGYLQGWKDAARVTDIAIDYVKTNPQEALDGLEHLKELYDLKGVRAGQLAEQIDVFYSDPHNSNAPLSLAITAAKQRTTR